ncbi:hypothetical protein K435DRAFT_790904 [Dendrothele bispora CBS 962.96]|uniref:Uncharacterized protein n=1 Tax=Dendrothele bispora (strain CBS 962.96) TaxID=1314807 RepID=A0A4S8MNX3_DENBC|nr:hypothetical protein K435DRAFT_790904 [Dendrothele bispora CBS 962.96]
MNDVWNGVASQPMQVTQVLLHSNATLFSLQQFVITILLRRFEGVAQQKEDLTNWEESFEEFKDLKPDHLYKLLGIKSGKLPFFNKIIDKTGQTNPKDNSKLYEEGVTLSDLVPLELQ